MLENEDLREQEEAEEKEVLKIKIGVLYGWF